jgi:REP element-mobilizing transposase RayT
MPRPPRAHEPGGIYHVSTRGNNREDIYFDDGDRLAFRYLLGQTVRRYGWRIFAECLMTNHYHLVVQIDERGLSDGMCELNGGFARSVNYAHGRQNHLFGKRYDDTPVESDTHLLEVCRYVVLNPVRAGICVDPSEWPWSSFRATAGLELSPSWLAAGDVLRLFAAEPEAARRAYAAFVREGHARCQAPGGEATLSRRDARSGAGPP